MRVAAIKRGKGGIDDLLRGMNVQIPEDEKPVATVGENPFVGLFEKYEGFLGRYDENKKVGNKIGWVQNCIHRSSCITDILSSDEINQFLQTTIIYEEKEGYDDLTGIFITRLIQNSYNAGHNDFMLDTKSLTRNLNWLGAYLKGNEENEIQISITGNVGRWFGEDSEYGTYTITGNVGNDCGRVADHSTFNITGDVGDKCGWYVNNSTYNITGDVGDECGSQANNSTFNITGDVGDGCGLSADNSTYTIRGNVRNVCGRYANNSTFNITRNVGNDCGTSANNSTYTITGNVGNVCGRYANNSTFNITGNVGDECGSQANNSTFNITGDAGNLYGREAKYSTYTITGDVGGNCGWEANNCTFKTSNEKTLEQLRRYVSHLNTIIYVKKDGKEEVIR